MLWPLIVIINYYIVICKEENTISAVKLVLLRIKVITKLPNSEQSYKGKVQTHNYINRQVLQNRQKLDPNTGVIALFP
jgi:hypothetical protein